MLVWRRPSSSVRSRRAPSSSTPRPPCTMPLCNRRNSRKRSRASTSCRTSMRPRYVCFAMFLRVSLLFMVCCCLVWSFATRWYIAHFASLCRAVCLRLRSRLTLMTRRPQESPKLLHIAPLLGNALSFWRVVCVVVFTCVCSCACCVGLRLTFVFAQECLCRGVSTRAVRIALVQSIEAA